MSSPVVTGLTPEQAILRRRATLNQRRKEYISWMETFDKDRTAPTQVADWVRSIEQLDFALNELGLLMRDLGLTAR